MFLPRAHAIAVSIQNITDIFFNGAMAEKCFYTLVQRMLAPKLLRYKRLPSTSPANTSLSYNQKLNAWKAIIQMVEFLEI